MYPKNVPQTRFLDLVLLEWKFWRENSIKTAENSVNLPIYGHKSLKFKEFFEIFEKSSPTFVPSSQKTSFWPRLGYKLRRVHVLQVFYNRIFVPSSLQPRFLKTMGYKSNSNFDEILNILTLENIQYSIEGEIKCFFGAKELHFLEQIF